ncbi:MAG TPA: AzlD domain-containing protein [Propionicimonas sp.]|nr:AzlD domain-containing protein [Propionicimonas sp.]HRA05961.1 AzlD domain-containing protein [Propionicimonas sp.]
MSLSAWVLFAAATAYLIKLAGYLLPQSFLDRPQVHDLAAALTVGLLASLTVMNAVGKGQAIALDSRLLALAAGAIALQLKAPYIVVVIAGGVAAALGRLAGLP